MENACEGLGYDCGSYFRDTFWIAAAGFTGVAGSRYSGTAGNTLYGSISQDILGDPDCLGYGYQTSRPQLVFSKDPGQVKHIFRNAPGYFDYDTSANRALLRNAASADNLIKIDRFGNQWFAELLDDGTEVWVEVG